MNATPDAASSVETLLTRIKNPDAAVSGPAWQSAETCGAAAIQPLAEMLTDPDFEIARSAKRALYRITRHAGRPGAHAEAAATETALLLLLKHKRTGVRREALWMLSEIGTDRAVGPMAALLADEEVREDARCALLRLPGKMPEAALKAALSAAPEPFKYALADALRKRGVAVEGYPSQKRTPSRQTTVVPVAPKAK